MSTTNSPGSPKPLNNGPIYWTASTILVSIHIAAAVGVYYHPFHETYRATLLLAFVLWQAACFGITIGYHRLHSHKAFRVTKATRVVLALLGASAFQGSIRWWTLRHRLHHRYTDDPVHDPYAATRGMLWSHLGWMFFKPRYERLHLIDRDDLDRDPIVCWQHRNYIPLALLTGLVLPASIGWVWGDALGAFVWAGLVVRIAVWHCTFCVNSLAHWDGIQPYSDENTSRTNFITALITCGEGNHNFHTFPHDFRSGPSLFDWDPSKWIILVLHRCGLASGLRRARDEDLLNALSHMAQHDVSLTEKKLYPEDSEDVPAMGVEDIRYLVEAENKRTILLIEGYVIDATTYLKDHPGGAALLRRYAVQMTEGQAQLTREDILESHKEATWAFEGGLNNHSRMARERLRELALGKLSVE